jgi:uncharacterized protein (DUF1786 family)
VLPPDLAPVDWSILVVDVGSGATLAAQDEDRILWTGLPRLRAPRPGP